MRKVVWHGFVAEAVCQKCGARFGSMEFEKAKRHDELPCGDEPRNYLVPIDE